MIKAMKNVGKRLTEADIIIFQSMVGQNLPPAYFTFLLHNNGGRPVPNCFPIKGFHEGQRGEIQVFFGLGDEVESCDLVWNFREMNLSGRIPSNLIPIACDSSGDLICLSLVGDDAGAVLFWDYLDERDKPTYENVYGIADSFSEFIAGIRSEFDGG